MNKRAAIIFTFVLAVGLAAGCAQQPVSKALSPSEAHQKLLDILKEENNLRVITKEFKNALWIYLPFEKSFLEMKAKKKQPAGPSSAPTASPTIHFLEGDFNGQDFVIRYDIGSFKKYAKDFGYTSSFTEEYRANQRNILTAISRAYTGVEGSPTFFILVMADIVNGLETRIFLHIDDLKRAYSDQTFHGEYAKRVISDQPFGSHTIIGDTAGKHV
ncbi:MAG: hypothetical protein KAR32_07080, partial [Candidatus Omnitrophica bacterium]|nr:hypothetical protein [Candidatus Omnitrophota bacterium]